MSNINTYSDKPDFVDIVVAKFNSSTESFSKYDQIPHDNVSYDFGVGISALTNYKDVTSNCSNLCVDVKNYIVCQFELGDLPYNIFNDKRVKNSLELFITKWEDILKYYGNDRKGRYVCYYSRAVETIYQFDNLDFFWGLVNGQFIRNSNAGSAPYVNLDKFILFDAGRPLYVELKHFEEASVRDITSVVSNVLKYILVKDVIGIINAYVTFVPEIINIDSITLVTSDMYPMESYTSIS